MMEALWFKGISTRLEVIKLGLQSWPSTWGIYLNSQGIIIIVFSITTISNMGHCYRDNNEHGILRSLLNVW